MGKVGRSERRDKSSQMRVPTGPHYLQGWSAAQANSIPKVCLNKAAKPKLQPEKLLGSLKAWRQWDGEVTGSQLHWFASSLKYESHTASFCKDMASTIPPDLIHLFQMQLRWVAAVHGLAHMQVCTSVHAQTEWDKSQGPSNRLAFTDVNIDLLFHSINQQKHIIQKNQSPRLSCALPVGVCSHFLMD